MAVFFVLFCSARKVLLKRGRGDARGPLYRKVVRARQQNAVEYFDECAFVCALGHRLYAGNHDVIYAFSVLILTLAATYEKFHH